MGPLFYHARNLDMSAAHADAGQHYEQSGWREGRDPGPCFGSTGYLARNPDVAAARVDPLQHHLEYGMAEGRSPTG